MSAGIAVIGGPGVLCYGTGTLESNTELTKSLKSILKEIKSSPNSKSATTPQTTSKTKLGNSKSIIPTAIQVSTKDYLAPQEFLSDLENQKIVKEASKIISPLDAKNYGCRTATVLNLQGKTREETSKNLKALAKTPEELPQIIATAINASSDYSLGTNEDLFIAALMCLDKYNYGAVEHCLCSKDTNPQGLMDYVKQELSGKDAKEATKLIQNAKNGSITLNNEIREFNEKLHEKNRPFNFTF